MSTEFIFDGQLLCLDLVNTRIRSGGEAVDLLSTPEALAEWAGDAARVHDLHSARAGAPAPDEAAVHREAMRLRDAVLEIADAGIAGGTPPEKAVREINAASSRAPVLIRAVRQAGDFRQRRVSAGTPVVATLGDAARSAIRLLTELDPNRLGRCSHPDCILYYYDVTKNRSRRWCSMERCGNRAKVAAHYRRRKRDAAKGEGRA